MLRPAALRPRPFAKAVRTGEGARRSIVQLAGHVTGDKQERDRHQHHDHGHGPRIGDTATARGGA